MIGDPNDLDQIKECIKSLSNVLKNKNTKFDKVVSLFDVWTNNMDDKEG